MLCLVDIHGRPTLFKRETMEKWMGARGRGELVEKGELRGELEREAFQMFKKKNILR